VIAATKSDPGNCDLTPVSVFRTTDEVVKACFELDAVRKGDTVVIRFTRPDGTLHDQTSSAPLPADIEGAYIWQWYAIKDFPVAGFTGDWKVDLLWNGNVIKSLTFRLNPPVTVETVRVTNANPDALGCLDPGSARVFLPRDATATLWFTVSGAVAGDLTSIEFLAPDGSVFQRSEYDPLESGGNWCFWSWLNIKGDSPAGTFGTWTARVRWNDAVVLSQTFQILPVDVTGFLVTRATVAGSLCSTPVANTSFLTTDDVARLWFTVDAANAGDTPSVEWRDPAGTLAARSNFNSLSEGGSWCFSSGLTIAGQNRAPGTWTARALWNGVEVGRTTLQISRPGNDAPSMVAASTADESPATLSIPEAPGESLFRGSQAPEPSATEGFPSAGMIRIRSLQSSRVEGATPARVRKPKFAPSSGSAPASGEGLSKRR
jgi:hypothetical protein